MVDLTFIKRGKFNAIVFWYEMTSIDDIRISTTRESESPPSMRAA